MTGHEYHYLFQLWFYKYSRFAVCQTSYFLFNIWWRHSILSIHDACFFICTNSLIGMSGQSHSLRNSPSFTVNPTLDKRPQWGLIIEEGMQLTQTAKCWWLLQIVLWVWLYYSAIFSISLPYVSCMPSSIDKPLVSNSLLHCMSYLEGSYHTEYQVEIKRTYSSPSWPSSLDSLPSS